MTDESKHTRGCLCGGIRYAVHGPLNGVTVCHCSQCRGASGHFAAMTTADEADYYELEDAAPKFACAT